MNKFNLIQRCKEGYIDAFNNLFEEYSNQAIRTVYLIIGRSDISEDIVQEAFITCYKEIKSLKNPEAFQTWFYRLLTRILWCYVSKEKNHIYICSDNLLLSDIAEKMKLKNL